MNHWSSNSPNRFKREATFHNEWAASVKLEEINVIGSAEACTAPEMRQIINDLGDLKGRKVLDLGCGLGEASVYFALKGADVTATDISPEMLSITKALAERYRVSIRIHLSEAENLQLEGELFDVIYIGNLLHHVEIQPTLDRLKPLLDEKGVLVSWDPITYNPVINLYRWIAREVRTPDEHPLSIRDIKLFKNNFYDVKTSSHWLTTLLIFIIMSLKLNPNKVRFWKRVIDDAEKWCFLYKPLEKIDHFLLRMFPFLKWLCWNMIIFARKPK